MRVLATDNFSGTGALSGNWTTLVNAWQRVSSAAGPSNTSNAFNCSYYTGVSFPNDQWAQGTLTAFDNNNSPGVGVRLSSSGGYVLYKAFGASQNAVLAKISNTASNTDLHTYAVTVNATDVFFLGVQGTTLSSYQNGTLLGTLTDASFSSGSAGIWDFCNSNTDRINTFSAGDFGSSWQILNKRSNTLLRM